MNLIAKFVDPDQNAVLSWSTLETHKVKTVPWI